MSADRTTPVKPRRQRHGNTRSARQRVALILAIVGGVLFIASSIGARAGVVILPFDPHHVMGQFGGAAFALLGVSLMQRKR
ncbi:MAG: hypothetical protein KY461_02205 [Actinobacteria bacterium]|nr:hypothetical protein [Actinomycetota bacterium]